MRIVEISEREALNTLERQWRALQAQCPQATPFQTWEWNAAWWRHFGARKRPRILLFWASAAEAATRGTDGEAAFLVEPAVSTPFQQNSGSRAEVLIGIAPFYTSFHLGTPLRRLAWIGTGQSDYLGPLVLPEWEAAAAHALCHYIREELRGWDMADLQQLRADCPLLTQQRGQGSGVRGQEIRTGNREQGTGNSRKC